ncbi:MAG: sugar ABC transporter substrate-binding protein [Actinobacteria bacterium]|nr:sugar ABC transporter substrate-binding protein [Actinomycetota bacterium]MBO0787206.1 sugar ABC transporter substrate-binding protein [Actinomycetota bacterium]
MPRRRFPRPAPRKLALASVGAVIVTVAAACASAPSSPGQASGKINLTYAQWQTAETPGYQKSINVFEKAHPNIHVSIETFPYPNYQAKLTTEFSSGGGPDIFWVNTPMIASWLKDGVMKDLTAQIKAAHINLGQYLPTLVGLHRFGGKLYGLPKDWDTIAYFYNARYFRQHHITIPSSLSWNPSNGGTWVHFLREVTVDTSGHTALSPQFNPNSVATYAIDDPNQMQWGFEPFLAENGVRIIGQPYAKNVSFDTPAGRQTFQFLSDLMYKWHVAAPGSALGADGAANNGEDQQLFAKGKVAMIENGDWITSGLPGEVKFPIGVMPFPAGPSGNWTVLNGLIDSINSHGPHQQAAWELEKWLGSPASQKILGAGGYIWPGIPSLDPLFLKYWQSKGIDMQPFLAESHWHTVYWPVTPGMNQAQLDIEHQLAPAYLNGKNVVGAVGAAAKQANGDLATAG